MERIIHENQAVYTNFDNIDPNFLQSCRKTDGIVESCFFFYVGCPWELVKPAKLDINAIDEDRMKLRVYAKNATQDFYRDELFKLMKDTGMPLEYPEILIGRNITSFVKGLTIFGTGFDLKRSSIKPRLEDRNR